MSKEKKLTIFTPTFNRAYILPQLYSSLKAQTDKDFEWLIVDDGSEDETEALVSTWLEEGTITIRYIKQKNSGKMKAHNVGVKETKTELFLCVDSDDWLVMNSVETILCSWGKLSEIERENTAGLIAYRGKNSNEVIGNYFPDNVDKNKARLSELYAKGFCGDTTIVFKTSVIDQYPFPIIADEKFITEAYIYDQIDKVYTYHIIPAIIIVTEYRDDGLTLNLLKLAFKNPCGYTVYYIQRGNFSERLKDRMTNYIRANCFRHEIKGKELPVLPNDKLLYNLMYPFGTILYYLKKKEYKKYEVG